MHRLYPPKALFLVDNCIAFVQQYQYFYNEEEKDLIFSYNTTPFQLQLNCLKKHYIYFKGELKKEYKKIRLSIELFYFFCYLCVTNNLFYNDMQRL